MIFVNIICTIFSGYAAYHYFEKGMDDIAWVNVAASAFNFAVVVWQLTDWTRALG
jgi:hypothetical protein